MPLIVENSRELVRKALRGEETSRVAIGPLAVHFCAAWSGVSLRDYTLSAKVLADCVLRYYERFRPDAVCLSADTWVTAQAMGAAVAFPGEGQPLSGTGEHLVRSPADLARIPPPDPSRQGRCPMMIEALERVVEALHGEAFVVACFDQYPFSLACALMGVEQLMLALWDDRPAVEALLERCREYTVAYAKALARAGADSLTGGDSPAGLIGPRLFREVALAQQQRVIEEIHASCSLPVSLHVCGNATPFLADLAASGADVLELDHPVDLPAAAAVVGPETTIWGNLDPVGLLVQSRPDAVRKATLDLIGRMATCGHRRFVLSSGCTLAVDTPPENLDAMLQAAREYTNHTNHPLHQG